MKRDSPSYRPRKNLGGKEMRAESEKKEVPPSHIACASGSPSLTAHTFFSLFEEPKRVRADLYESNSVFSTELFLEGA